MKKITTVIIIILSSMRLYAQQPAHNDSIIIGTPPPSPPDYSGTLSNYYLSAELTANWLNPLPEGVNNNVIGGLGLAVNAQRKIFLVKKNLYLSIGLGIATYDYATNAVIENDRSLSASSYFVPIPSSVNYSKNKLNLVWLQVPVEFHYQTKPNAEGNNFDFELGARFGYLINDHTKQKGTDTLGNTYKVKIYELPNLDQFSTMVTAKIGYNHANLFFYYNILPLFVQDDIETANEFGAGVAITF